MTGAAAVVAAHPTLASGRYGVLSSNGGRVSHLLTKSWPEDGRKTRPALCGERRMRWQAVTVIDPHGAFAACVRCDDIAADLVAPRAPERFAPKSQAIPHVPEGIECGVPQLTQAERTLARRRFRRSFELSDDAKRYLLANGLTT